MAINLASTEMTYLPEKFPAHDRKSWEFSLPEIPILSCLVTNLILIYRKFHFLTNYTRTQPATRVKVASFLQVFFPVTSPDKHNIQKHPINWQKLLRNYMKGEFVYLRACQGKPWIGDSPEKQKHTLIGIRSLVPPLIGPPSHWSPSHWSPNSLVPHYIIGAHWSPISLVPHIIGPPSHWSPHFFISHPIIGQSQWSPISLVPHLIGSPSHWSPNSSVPHLIGPPNSTHASPIPLVPHLIGPPDSLVPHLNGPPSHWSPSHWSPNS